LLLAAIKKKRFKQNSKVILMTVEAQIVEHLINDTRFNFKEVGEYLQKGTCPDCSKDELYIRKSQPYVLACNRLNHCQYAENTRDIYPEIFQQLSKTYPATEENSQATADAYMQYDRQFDISKIKHWYSQDGYHLRATNEYVNTVRFYFDESKERYWERLIDKAKADGQRFNIGGKRKSFSKSHEHFNDYNKTLYKGEWWKPSDIEIKQGDTVYLVEGILHAIGLYLSGHKTAAIIGASNFPSLAIQPYLAMDITWRLALDDDNAGRKSMLAHAQKLKKLDQKVELVLTGEEKQDWDDLYRAKRLTSRFMEECLYRGRLFGATSIKEKAYFWYCKTSGVYTVLDFNNQYFSITVDMQKLDSETLGTDNTDDVIMFKDVILTKAGKQAFNQSVKITPITNCRPEFLYCEQQQSTGELAYFFNVGFPNMPDRKISLTGSALESPGALNKSLLNQAPGAGFDGSISDFKTIKNRWFNDKILMVETVPFLGYDKHSQSYIFNQWGYHQGKRLTMNRHGYFEVGKRCIKSSFKSFSIHQSDSFVPNWLPDFEKVFSTQGMVALAFWFGSLFAQQIRAAHKDFPFLELTGEHGAGKTTLIEFLWKLIGRDDYEGFDPGKATFAARARAFSQVSNMPVVLIESDRDDKAKKGGFDFEELKTAFNGRAIRSIGSFNRGNDIEEPSFNGSIVIAQNASVDGSPALLSRIVHCHCTKVHFTADTKRLAQQFTRATVGQLSGFLKTALANEKPILQHFAKMMPIYDAQLTKGSNMKDHRIIKTHSMIAAIASALQFVFPNYTEAMNQRLVAFIFERAESRQQRMNADHPLVQQFWEVFDLINDRPANHLNGGYAIHQPILNHSTKPDVIAINLNHFYQVCRDRNIELIHTNALRKLLPLSYKNKFISTKNVHSGILDKAVWCMVFKNANAQQ
jgi:hypothetical protein